jgi:hypothetical protein
VYYDFISAQHPQQHLHPRLVIDYTSAGGAPTATEQVTATPTSSGTPPPTLTATATATHTPAPTQTPTSSPLPSATPSAPPTQTPTPFPGGENTITLQQGVEGYQGTSDTFICAWNPAGNFALQGNLIVKNDSVYSSLVRFDLTSVPDAATINQATLRLFAYNRNNSVSLDLEVYRVLRPWVAQETTWDRASDGTAWGVPGCNDTNADRAADPLAIIPVSATSSWYEADVTGLVQSWLADPAANYGVILRGFGTVSVLYDFGSSRHPTISLHPQLVIDYAAPVVPTDTPAAPTPTQTASATATSAPTNTPTRTPTETASTTPSPTVTHTGTLPPTATSTPAPTSEFEQEVEQMEHRVSVLEALVQSIIDIFRRAAGLGR